MAEKIVKSSRDIPGTMREYETIYILRPDVANEVLAGLNTKVRSLIEAGGGRLLKVTNWGRRKLAYTLAKQTRGVYVFFHYLSPQGVSDEAERHLSHSDVVIRYYTVKIAENVDPATRTSEVTDESFATAGVPAVEEETVATGQAGVRGLGDEYEEAGFDFEEAVFGTTDPQPRRS